LNGQTITLSKEEAQKLFFELKKIFEQDAQKEYVPCPYPVYPDYPIYPPYPTYPQSPFYYTTTGDAKTGEVVTVQNYIIKC